MPEALFAFILILCALNCLVMLGGNAADTITRHRDRRAALAEREAARLTARANAAARASAHAARTAELDAFDAAARRILDAADVPCVCSQVLTHEWDGHTQSYRQRWKVPEHFTACLKHWPAATGAPPATAAGKQRQGGPPLPRDERLAAAMLREYSRTTYGVPDDCTCVPDHAHASLANTHVLHRVDCATNRGPHAAG